MRYAPTPIRLKTVVGMVRYLGGGDAGDRKAGLTGSQTGCFSEGGQRVSLVGLTYFFKGTVGSSYPTVETEVAILPTILRTAIVGDVIITTSDGLNAGGTDCLRPSPHPALDVMGSGFGQGQNAAFLLRYKASQGLFDRFSRSIYGKERVVGKLRLLPLIDSSQPIMVMGVVFEVLNAEFRVSGVDIIVSIGLFGSVVVRFRLIQGRRIAFELVRIILQDHLIVVVLALQVTIDGCVYVDVEFAVCLTPLRADGESIDAAATEAVRHSALSDGHSVLVELHYIGKKYCSHHSSGFCIDVFTRHLLRIKDTYIKSILALAQFATHLLENASANGVVLVLYRPVQLSTDGVEVNTTQVTGQSRDRSKYVALEIGLDQLCSEGEIGMTALQVDGYSLHMRAFLGIFNVDSTRKSVDGGCLRLRRMTDEGDSQKEKANRLL